MKFSIRLKELRNEKGLIQASLASLMKVGRPTIAGYESKGKQPDYDKLIWLADFFDVSTDYLLGRSDIKKPCADPENKELLVLFDNLSPADKKKGIEMIHLLFDSKKV